MERVDEIHLLLLRKGIRLAWLLQPIDYGEDIPRSYEDAGPKTREIIDYIKHEFNVFFYRQGVVITLLDRRRLREYVTDIKGLGSLLGYCDVDMRTAKYVVMIDVDGENLLSFLCDRKDYPRVLYERVKEVVAEHYPDSAVTLEIIDKEVLDTDRNMLENLSLPDMDITMVLANDELLDKMRTISDVLKGYGGLTIKENKIFSSLMSKYAKGLLTEKELLTSIPKGDGYWEKYNNRSRCTIL